MEEVKSFNISEYKGNEYIELENLIDSQFSELIKNQTQWKIVEVKDKSYNFINNPHSLFKQLLNSLLNIPWLEGNELVTVSFKTDKENRKVALRLKSEDMTNTFDKIIGVNHRRFNIFGFWFQRKKNSRNITDVYSKFSDLAEVIIKAYEKERQNKNIELINSTLNSIPVLVVNKNLSLMLKNVQTNFDHKIISNIVTLISHYNESVNYFQSIFSKLTSQDFHKEEQHDIDFTLKLLPIYVKKIELFENSILNMINCLEENDLTSFYQIYNEFEKLGFFISAGEKTIINSIKNTNQLITEQINLSITVAEKLSKIQSQFNYLNFLTTLNTIKTLIK
jgi:hypothetical protein